MPRRLFVEVLEQLGGVATEVDRQVTRRERQLRQDVPVLGEPVVTLTDVDAVRLEGVVESLGIYEVALVVVDDGTDGVGLLRTGRTRTVTLVIS